ncbi:hypothetical protein AV530_005924 [Patagioenas fasciata monilis]|uniref:Uncharacterized protein n=1 Tax=Patagioenas fasciata monilis TaxID=372326 RepID=A0A1V4JN22_PATFA|nr:hypothetical protein AV530_005924 [Patagioenas fasciata monilis]
MNISFKGKHGLLHPSCLVTKDTQNEFYLKQLQGRSKWGGQATSLGAVSSCWLEGTAIMAVDLDTNNIVVQRHSPLQWAEPAVISDTKLYR